LERHLDEAWIDADVNTERTRSIERAAIGTAVDRGGFRVPDADREALSLASTQRAEGRIFGLDHILVAVGVADEPDLGHTFDADQKCGRQRAHGPSDLLRCGGHRSRSTTSSRLWAALHRSCR